MLIYLFAGVFHPTLCLTKLRVLVMSFPGFTDISIETSFCANKMMNGVFSYGRIFALQPPKNISCATHAQNFC
jgi:hypothetical protein